MPAWVYIATAVYVLIELLANVATVGKPRGPRTPLDACVAVVAFGWIAFLLIAAVAA